jgi:hypothetical protein
MMTSWTSALWRRLIGGSSWQGVSKSCVSSFSG